jgi:hypothetical protein
MEQAVTERDIAKLLQLSPEYVLRFHPEMYAQLFGDRAQTDALRLQALTELAKSGMINMGALTGGDNRALQGAIQQMLTGAPSPAPAPLPPNTTAQLPAGRFPQANARDRLQAEAAALRGQGMHVMLKEEMGAYYAQITLHDSQNHTLALYFICTAQYPQQAPTMFLELDQVQQQYTPDALASWNAQRSLVDLVEAVVTAYS